MSPEQKGPINPKVPDTGMSGRESVFDRRLREYRNTGGLAKPTRKTLQFIKNPTAEFETPSMDSKLHATLTDTEEFTEIERMAFIDESSGLLNARTIMGKIAIEARRSARYKHNFSLLMIELDGYSNMQSLTQLANEMIFSNFCKVLNKNIREVDKIGRFDKPSLLLVCPETNLSEAMAEAERLRHVISNTGFRQVGHHNSLTVSIGIATFPTNGSQPVDLLGAVMEAAQQAVANGGNTICCAKIDLTKSEKTEDFSPDSISKLTEDLKTEDMNPAATDKASEIAFPAADVTNVIP